MIQVFPTRNIHLVRAVPDAELELTVSVDLPFGDPAAVWTDVRTAHEAALVPMEVTNLRVGTSPAKITDFKDATNPSRTGLTIRADGVGTAFYRLIVSVPSASFNRHAALRIATHDDVDHLILPYGDIYLFEGRNDFVLTVFAKFTDNEQWDVSEHPWLEYGTKTANDPVVAVDNGRLVAGTSGETDVWVQVRGRPASRVTVHVHVATIASWMQGADPQIRSRTIRRPKNADRRLYLLSEGYTEHERFERHANEITEQMFTDANEPFQWVRDRFEVTWIYVRSAGTRGITVAAPVTYDTSKHTIYPMPPKTVVLSGNLAYDPGHLNTFGLRYGARIGDVDAPLLGPGVHDLAGLTEAVVGATEVRSLSIDLRRVGPYRTFDPQGVVQLHDPRKTFVDDFKTFLGKLGFTIGANDRIAFIVDDQMRGGARFSIGGMQPVPNPFVSMSIGAFDDYFDGVQQKPDPIALRVSVTDPYSAEYVASSVVHELGHTYRLGDEYESNKGTQAQNDDSRSALEEYDNIQLRDDVIVNGRVDVRRLKWYVPRPKKVSVIKTISAPSPSTLLITLDGNPSKRWKEFERVRVRSSFAVERPRDANKKVDPAVPRLRDFAYEVNEVSDTQIVLFSAEGGANGDVTGLSILYAPVFDDIDPVYVIEPGVIAHLQGDPAHGFGIFPRANANCDPTKVDGTPPAIQNVKPPKNASELIGIYEGGFYAACGVIRPTGRCKIRHAAGDVVLDQNENVTAVEVIEYCYVCKLILSDLIDPSVAPKLRYPKGT